MNKPLPNTLLEAVEYFGDEEVAHNFAVQLRWPDGVACPTCGHKELSYISTRRLWKCKNKDCVQYNKQFSVKRGTIFEDSPIAMSKWLPAIWMIANNKNGKSSYELARDLGVTQKTAWFMLHRIRTAMQKGTFEKLSGTVEADETFIGGVAKNMHKDKREAKIKGRGPSGKAVVMGLLERKGEVRAGVIPNTTRKTLHEKVRRHVESGSQVYTDSFPAYQGLHSDYIHEMVDHAVAYANGQVHTNGIENFWSLLKRSVKGTYVSVDAAHLTRYVDEQAFRFNTRKEKDLARFKEVLSSTTGRRLTYKQLIGDLPKRGG